MENQDDDIISVLADKYGREIISNIENVIDILKKIKKAKKGFSNTIIGFYAYLRQV